MAYREEKQQRKRGGEHGRSVLFEKKKNRFEGFQRGFLKKCFEFEFEGFQRGFLKIRFEFEGFQRGLLKNRFEFEFERFQRGFLKNRFEFEGFQRGFSGRSLHLITSQLRTK